MLNTIAISNYRSLRQLVLPLTRLNVVTGANGSGKSNLYRALRLLSAAACGDLVAQLSREGGLPSTLWAGPERISAAMRSGRQPVQGTVRKERIQLRLGFSSEDFGYCLDLGLPGADGATAFPLDPEFKLECIWSGPIFRLAARLAERRGPVVRTIDDKGAWQVVLDDLPRFESMMTEFVNPRLSPEMGLTRARLRSWRFYDHFRSDRDAPARKAQIGTYTPVLGHDGSDLGAALQTILAIGDAERLERAVDDAFPGSVIEINQTAGRLEVTLRQPGLLRPLSAAELSDGTLRYLLVLAALLTPRPPEFLVLNEPETSLHPDLLPSLARLITDASRSTQVMVVTHSAALLRAFEGMDDIGLIALEKSFGETVLPRSTLDEPAWIWPSR